MTTTLPCAYSHGNNVSGRSKIDNRNRGLILSALFFLAQIRPDLGWGHVSGYQMKTAYSVASEILLSRDKMERQQMEVTDAFVAKHGYEPDLCKQVRRKGEWCLIRMEPEEVIRIRRELIERLFYAKPPTLWQRFCLWMARLK